MSGKDGNGGSGLIDALIGSEMFKKLQTANENIANAKPTNDENTINE